MKKLIAILLTAILVISAVPVVSATEDAASPKLQNLPDDFAAAVNRYIPDNDIYSDYPTFTMDNLEGIEFYKITAEQVVFRIIGLTNSKASQLLSGYLFTAPTSYGYSNNNPCGYCVYSGGRVYDLYYAAINLKVVTVDELAQIIPNTIKLNNNNLVSYFSENGVGVTWVNCLGQLDNSTLLCYAGVGDTLQADTTLTLGNYNFHITTAQSPDNLGLYCVASDRVRPIKSYYVNYNKVVSLIRKAEANGEQFGFTVSHKLGDEVELCLTSIADSVDSPITPDEILAYGKLKNHNYFAVSTTYSVREALFYHVLIGDWLFFSDSQNPNYDLGIYIVDIDSKKAYTLDEAYYGGMLSDDDMDDVISVIGTSGSGWSVQKLTEIQKKFLIYKYGEGSSFLGREHIYGYTCTEYGEFEGYVIVGSGDSAVENLGKYLVKTTVGQLYLYKDDKFITLTEAYSDGIINDENIDSFIAYLVENNLGESSVPETNPTGTTEPSTDVPEPATEATSSTEPVTEPTQPATYSISKAKVSAIANRTYTGKAITPTIKVTYNSKILLKNKDYTLSYKNNKNVGTASVVITGKGSYTGKKTVSFKIVKAANTITVKAAAKTVKYKNVKKAKQTVTAITVKKAIGKVTYKKSSGSKFLSVTSKGKITVKKGTKKGTYIIKVKVTAAGSSNYKSGSKTVTVKIKVK